MNTNNNNSLTQDQQNTIIRYTGDGDVSNVFLKKFYMSPIGLFMLKRLVDNRDFKANIVSRGSTTGTGKTTLAILLAKIQFYINQKALYGEIREHWTADEFAFIDGWEYINYYKQQARSGDTLVIDEVQTAMDSRRSMTERQVEFSQTWEKLRYKNVGTFTTSPGIHRVDKRVNETTDLLFILPRRGIANVYYQTIDDFTGATMWYKFKFNNRPVRILFGPNDDADKKALDDMKRRDDVNQNNFENGDDVNPQQLLTDYRTQMCLSLLNQKYDESHPFTGTQKDIAELIPKDPDEPLTSSNTMSQKWVSKVKVDIWDGQEFTDKPVRELR